MSKKADIPKRIRFKGAVYNLVETSPKPKKASPGIRVGNRFIKAEEVTTDDRYRNLSENAAQLNILAEYLKKFSAGEKIAQFLYMISAEMNKVAEAGFSANTKKEGATKKPAPTQIKLKGAVYTLVKAKPTIRIGAKEVELDQVTPENLVDTVAEIKDEVMQIGTIINVQMQTADAKQLEKLRGELQAMNNIAKKLDAASKYLKKQLSLYIQEKRKEPSKETQEAVDEVKQMLSLK